MFWNLLFSKVICFGKSQKSQCSTVRGTESPKWFEILPKNSAQDMLHERAHYHDEAHSRSLLNHLNSFCRGMCKLNAKSDADSLLYWLSHFECNGHTVHMFTKQSLLHPLTSTAKMSLFTHDHSSPLSWLPDNIDVTQTIIVILKRTGLFSDRHPSPPFPLAPVRMGRPGRKKETWNSHENY